MTTTQTKPKTAVVPRRQFKHKKPTEPYYDKPVRHVASTIYIPMGRIIPQDWRYVRITILRKTPKTIELRIFKLLGDEDYTQTTPTNKTSKQNT